MEFLKLADSGIRGRKRVEMQRNPLAVFQGCSVGVGCQNMEIKVFRELEKQLPHSMADYAIFRDGAVIIEKKMFDFKGMISRDFNFHTFTVLFRYHYT